MCWRAAHSGSSVGGSRLNHHLECLLLQATSERHVIRSRVCLSAPCWRSWHIAECHVICNCCWDLITPVDFASCFTVQTGRGWECAAINYTKSKNIPGRRRRRRKKKRMEPIDGGQEGHGSGSSDEDNDALHPLSHKGRKELFLLS